MAGPISLGIDIGGTFTDLVALDHRDGGAAIWKESTTPDDPSRGALEGIRNLLAHGGIAAHEIGRVVHATTLFTNALIERKGAPTGLLTTAGFADVLEIGRERKYELYDLSIEMPAPLVPRPWRREVSERLAPDGTIVSPLDVEGVLRQAEALAEAGVRSLAIVFLHAYANPCHERIAAEAIASRFPDLSLSLSSDVAPEIREYPRASTTVANAYVRPIAETYLDRLETALAGIGIPGRLFLMLSSGGLTHMTEAKRAPVQLLESGPAAGALAGAWFGRSAGLDRVLAFDMGGTTAKLALVDDGEPLVGWGFEAARQKRFLRGSGLPIQIATIELIEIGAGGGSIARRSELGTLQVGPESAGAVPGPACYGRGGTAPTVTDSDLLLGYLDAGFFLGGEMRVDAAAASASLERLAASLAVTPARAAAGVHDVVNETMAGAARVAIAERGGALRDYTLLATGGAGPVHAWRVARKLGLRRLICPPGAGAGSALGMLMAPARVDRVASVNTPLERVEWEALAETMERLRQDGLGIIGQSGADAAGLAVRRMADMRYVGQGFEITVTLPETLTQATLREAFERRYRALFTRTAPDAAIEVVTLRLSLTAPMPGARRAITLRHAEGPRSNHDALKGHRSVRFPEQDSTLSAPVYDRYALRPGTRLLGPAIVEENESTFVIGPGGNAEILADGSIAVELP
jgi:N-methylhydantoinase A